MCAWCDSGSALGRIHHLDPRAPAALVGVAVQNGGVCSLQWSPGDDCLASGSTEGLLHIWDGDVAGGATGLKEPVTTMTQPSAVKVNAPETRRHHLLLFCCYRNVFFFFFFTQWHNKKWKPAELGEWNLDSQCLLGVGETGSNITKRKPRQKESREPNIGQMLVLFK